MNVRKREISYIFRVLLYLILPLFINASQLHAQENDASKKSLFIKVYPLQYVANKQFLFGVAYHYTNKQVIEIQAGPLLKDYFYKDLLYTYSFLPAVGGSFHLNHRYILNSKMKSKSLMYINNQVFAKYVKLKEFRDYREVADGSFDSLYQLKYVMGYKLLFGMEFSFYRSFYLDINTGIGLRFRSTNTVRFYRQAWQYEVERFYVDKSEEQTIDNWFGLTPHFQLGLGYKIR
jgi:hypothetical protein